MNTLAPWTIIPVDRLHWPAGSWSEPTPHIAVQKPSGLLCRLCPLAEAGALDRLHTPGSFGVLVTSFAGSPNRAHFFNACPASEARPPAKQKSLARIGLSLRKQNLSSHDISRALHATTFSATRGIAAILKRRALPLPRRLERLAAPPAPVHGGEVSDGPELDLTNARLFRTKCGGPFLFPLPSLDHFRRLDQLTGAQPDSRVQIVPVPPARCGRSWH